MDKAKVNIPVLLIRHGDTTYGAGGCDVHVGGGEKLPAIAVTCEGRAGARERHITDEKGAQTWLHERGLPLMVAWGLVNEVRNGLGADVHGAATPTASPGDKLWKQVNAASHHFVYDSPDAKLLTAAAHALRQRDL